MTKEDAEKAKDLIEDLARVDELIDGLATKSQSKVWVIKTPEFEVEIRGDIERCYVLQAFQLAKTDIEKEIEKL